MKQERPDPIPFEDPRHERFAEMVCQGYSLAEAYREAMQRRISKSGADKGGRRLMERPDVGTFIAAYYDHNAAQIARRERINGLSAVERVKLRLWK